MSQFFYWLGQINWTWSKCQYWHSQYPKPCCSCKDIHILLLGQVFSHCSNVSRLRFDQHISQSTNFWPRYHYDISQIFSKKYTIKCLWYDQPMTKIRPNIFWSQLWVIGWPFDGELVNWSVVVFVIPNEFAPHCRVRGQHFLGYKLSMLWQLDLRIL